MKLSHAAHTVLSICWDGDEPRSTSFIIGDTYSFKGTEFKPTEDTYDELVKNQEMSNKPYKVVRFGKVVNVIGKRVG
ncbi:hypothetical protein [Paenibacillus lactis]|uniref:hypothetical protein n=1 Tax=Paenibacillus lactis TaxID=228574 RepID=UPI003D71C967